jgi:predicted DNA-binding transcriptional regulator AlpA
MKSKPENDRLYMAAKHLCARWGVSIPTLRRWLRDGYLPKPIRLGRGALRWPVAEIEAIEQRAAADRGEG